MDFLNKLDSLMEEKKLNKSSLSKACGIPYTTIDGWYKKGYEGLKLTTLRKLSDFFGVSLDYWINDYPSFPPVSSESSSESDCLSDLPINDEVKELARLYSHLSDSDKILVKNLIDSLSEKSSDNHNPGNT